MVAALTMHLLSLVCIKRESEIIECIKVQKSQTSRSLKDTLVAGMAALSPMTCRILWLVASPVVATLVELGY